MRLNNDKLFAWSEKYRPTKISDMVLPAKIKDQLQGFVDGGNIPNVLLSGPPGTGKTTAALAMVQELDVEYMFINGSMKGNIDTLRNEIQSFASSLSIKGKMKYVILDEGDFLTQNTQAALRGFFQEFADNCGFIITCNMQNRIMPAIAQSRCVLLDFNYPRQGDEAADLTRQMFAVASKILKENGVQYDKTAVAMFIAKHYPFWRRILNELQAYAQKGSIDSGILASFRDFPVLTDALKKKNFDAMRRWVGENSDVESAFLYRHIYDNLSTMVHPESIPAVIVILAKYQYQESFCADREINTAACMTELMLETRFK